MDGLHRLLRPRSIAVIGGGAWCRNVINSCRALGFDGAIWPVHPNRPEIEGERAYGSVANLPSPPDGAFVGVNRTASIEVVRALAELGTGGAVCFASGFREAQAEAADGANLQEQLLAAAGTMRLIGPNCYGVLNLLDGAALWPDIHGATRVARGVAIITQSSNVALNLTMQRRGLPLAYVATAGNQAQTGLSDIGGAMLEDPRVTALGLHIEGIDDLRAFEALAARARGLGKPIVALKIGRSDEARAASISHTASIVGGPAGAAALLARLGIAQVHSLPLLLETLKLLHVAGPLASGRIASLSCSGGEAGLMADTAAGTGVTFPPLSEAQKTDLRAALGPLVALANPLDYHTYIWGDEAALTATISAMAVPGVAIVVVVLDFPRLDRCSAHDWNTVLAAVAAVARRQDVPIGVAASLPENLPEEVAETLVAIGVVPFFGLEETIAAINLAAGLGGGEPAAAVHLAKPPSQTRTLTEAEAKGLLKAAGIRVPLAERADSAPGAVAAAERIGFPVVLKGEGIAHKTEAGAVALGLRGADAVATAAAAMPCHAFLVEEMVTGTVAELLVGVVRDPAHGFVLTLAAGGTLTELLGDAASLLVPSGRREIRAALKSLRLAPFLAGYRGQAAVDLGAVEDVILAVQALVIAGAVEEIEINPLMCGPSAAIAADALIRIGEPDD